MKLFHDLPTLTSWRGLSPHVCLYTFERALWFHSRSINNCHFLGTFRKRINRYLFVCRCGYWSVMIFIHICVFWKKTWWGIQGSCNFLRKKEQILYIFVMHCNKILEQVVLPESATFVFPYTEFGEHSFCRCLAVAIVGDLSTFEVN